MPDIEVCFYHFVLSKGLDVSLEWDEECGAFVSPKTRNLFKFYLAGFIEGEKQ